MAAQEILGALGGSLATDELKGDYAAAEAAAADALAEARAESEPQALAEAAIWASIVSSLRSEPAAAGARLDEALAAVAGHPLADAVRDLAVAAGRRLPDGNQSIYLMVERPHVWSTPPDGDPLAAELSALAQFPFQRAGIQQAITSPDPAPLQIAGAGALRALELVAAHPYALLEAAGLERAAGQSDAARARLELAVAAYTAADDPSGLAACELVRGAWAAVSACSPVTFGLALVEPLAASTTHISGVHDHVLAPVPDVTASAPFYERAEAGFRAAGAPRGVATVELHRAAVAALHDDPASALHAAERSRMAFEAAGDGAGAHLAAAHVALARIHAREWPEPSGLAAEIGAWGAGPGSFGWALGIGSLFSQMGWRWLRRDGDADRAVACHRLAEATYNALGAAEFAQQTHTDRAEAYKAAGDTEAAIAACDRSLRTLGALQAERGATSLPLVLRDGDLAMSFRTLAHWAGDGNLLERLAPMLEQARARLESLASGEKTGDATVMGERFEALVAAGGMADVLRGTASIYASALASDAALAPIYRARRLRRQSPVRFRALRERALAAAAEIPEPDRGRIEARVHMQAGDLEAGREAFARYPIPEAEATVADASLAVWLHDWQEARRRHEALAQQRPDWWRGETDPWRYLGYLAETAEGLGELPRARTLYDSALDLLDEQRGRLTARDDRGTRGDIQADAELYGNAARAVLAADPGSAATALELAERGRARSLLSRMAGSAALAVGDRQQADELREWRRLAARVEALASLAAAGGDAEAAELAEAEAALRAAEASLAAQNPRWLEAVTPQIGLLGAQEIAAALPSGVVLIEHLLVSGAMLGWAVTTDGHVEARLTPVDDAAVDDLQQDFWTACKGQSPKWERYAERLGDLLLAPFAAAIEASEHVLLVPHRWGRRAPVSALTWRGEPLLEGRTVSVLPAAAALRFLPAPAPLRAGRLLAVGDPANMSRRRPGEATASGGFGAMPWSGAQAAEAAAWLGGDTPLLGSEAREAAVRARIADARIIHFATHGELDDAPLLSSIVLAEGDTLDVWELLGLPLDADLVTLSACDSAGGAAAGGDELVGLGWLTLAAGARAVVASLWKVSELSTALLMRRFYRALSKGTSPRVALTEAQREMRGLTLAAAQPDIEALRAAAAAAGRPVPELPPSPPEDFSHPYHWAGFVLIGV